MGFMKRWDVLDIESQLHSCYAQASSGYNDGFVSRSCKHDLIRLKYIIDNMLENCPDFVGDDELIEELEKEKTWRVLKHG
jgi:hypothetical protein